MNVTTASKAMAFDTGAPRNQTAFGLCSCVGDVDMIMMLGKSRLLGDAYSAYPISWFSVVLLLLVACWRVWSFVN
jgi:hypothetical protein